MVPEPPRGCFLPEMIRFLSPVPQDLLAPLLLTDWLMKAGLQVIAHLSHDPSQRAVGGGLIPEQKQGWWSGRGLASPPPASLPV